MLPRFLKSRDFSIGFGLFARKMSSSNNQGVPLPAPPPPPPGGAPLKAKKVEEEIPEKKPALTKLSHVEDPKSVSEEEWRKVLPSDVYHVTREAGTEAPYTGKYDKFFKPGKYQCICCGADLFVSDSKYNSGCGWPAFSKSVDEDKNIVRIPDYSGGMVRVEVRCKQCNAHLGHVFDDGPKDTGERYCINSCSIAFQPKKDGE